MEFKSGRELLDLCKAYQKPISSIMLLRECELFDASPDYARAKMQKALKVMKEAALTPLTNPKRSMGGLIGGEAKLMYQRNQSGKSLFGGALAKAVMYAMATIEVNASMGIIVAAPTAGAAGVVPGLLLALADEFSLKDDALIDALFNAGAIGYLAMRNASVAGAVGGCQAEVGVAAAMASSAAVEIMGGTPKQCLDAASLTLMNMLGLVCDPIGGLVECPCQGRNASGASNALVAAEITLAGVEQFVPFDEMLDAMVSVGQKMAPELRETALGGVAATPSACKFACCGGHCGACGLN